MSPPPDPAHSAKKAAEAPAKAPALCVKFVLESGAVAQGLRPVSEDLSAEALYVFARADTGHKSCVLYTDACLTDMIVDDAALGRLAVDNRYVERENEYIDSHTNGKIGSFQCFVVFVRALPGREHVA
ncbi:hypothetical protein IWQ56_002526 [Coemansia nantahalensis]|uniref:Uncharacterized protein n=1 Tax=Coemansia helicoidea TaxID=1286919 RepID=A0ACC1L7H2_9FUNG|nr:hypothetical protein IWQ56_002526 [Coemansia nantahalensis]KAJ2802051.1 hypothetical protein H4R21_002569 [Coemansia helicoidea]